MHGYTVKNICLSAYSEREYGAPAVLLLDAQRPFLIDIDDSSLTQLKRVLANAPSIVWVTHGSFSQGSRPEDAMVLGFKRSLMAEQAALKLKVIDSAVLDDFAVENIITQVATETEDTEFLIQDGIVHVNRLNPHLAVNSIHKSLCQASPRATVLAEQRLTGILAGISQPTIEFVHEQRRQLPTGYVEVEIRAIGVNNEV